MHLELLQNTLYKILNWHPARITTFAELIFAVIKAKTVTLKELAMHISSKGNLHARIIKLERLLLLQDMNFTEIGKIIIKLLGSQSKVRIAIDRTNWQFGTKNLNFFVAVVVWGNISIPITWLLLDKKGNSSTEERKSLVTQILDIIPQNRIEIMLADREFVGEEWLGYLISAKNLPFAIRVKKDEQIRHPNGGKIKLGKYFSQMRVGEYRSIETKLYGLSIKITCLQLATEQLLVASNCLIGQEALLAYKQRWSIERSFLSLKTSGFNIEDTHITDLKKLRKLFAIVSVALAICVIAGDIKNKLKPIIIKKHGRRAYSLFTYGLDWLKDYFLNPFIPHLKHLLHRLLCHITHVFL